MTFRLAAKSRLTHNKIRRNHGFWNFGGKVHLHEYQAKALLRRYNVAVHDFMVVKNLQEVDEVIEKMGLDSAVVKVQVHAGGRGKAGGVKVAKNKDEIKKHAMNMLGMNLVTIQTGKEGLTVHEVMIARLASIEKEYYVGIITDREKACPILMISPEGGVEIEEVAEKTPEKILKISLSLDGALSDAAMAEIFGFLKFEDERVQESCREFMDALCKAFVELDGELLEINPMIDDGTGKLWALDAKLSIDDNALFRQKEAADMYDPSQVPASEAEAHRLDLAYIPLEGEIGCMVNGAGLAMATMDLIKVHGSTPANFLDVGGSATKEKVAKGFELILRDPSVKAILVNIFGGIMKCDVIAEGIIAAAKELEVVIPLVVRLEGTNVEKGRAILASSGLKVIAAENLTDAAKKVVEGAKGYVDTH